MKMTANGSSKIKILTKTSTLWLMFTATLLITFMFPMLANQLGLTLIDAIASPDQVRKILSDMTADQRSAHAWITGTLDVAYPLAYGFLFAGVALQFFPKAGPYLAILALLAIPVDLIEGVIQILALTETADLLVLKTFVTPLKMALFLGGLLIALAGWAKWVYLRFNTGKEHESDA